MNLALGIITAEKSMENIKRIVNYLPGNCTVTFLPYYTLAHCEKLYAENAYLFDGILFSGELPYTHIVSHLGAAAKPHAFFCVSDREYYMHLLKALIKNRALDITRIAVENPLFDMNWQEAFGESIPKILTLTDGGLIHNTTILHEKFLEEYLRLWAAGEIDLVMTRLTNIAGDLARASIPYQLLLPSAASMIETVHSLIEKIQAARLSDYISVFAYIQPEDTKNLSIMELCVQEFNKNNSMQLVINIRDGMVEIFTSNHNMKDITQNYRVCTLSTYIKKGTDKAFNLGWGIGLNITQAQRNAQKALNESRRSGEGLPYIITEDDLLIGPLIQGKSLVMNTISDGIIAETGPLLGISPVNLQKLLSIIKSLKMNTFSSDDIAFYLNITPRSANRILKRLMDAGYAHIHAKAQPNAKGRPKTLYKLDFSELLYQAQGGRK